MGVIRSRANIEEQQSSNEVEVEQPLLKKLCPFVDAPIDDDDDEQESESDSEGEEHEDHEDGEESESDSGEEEDGAFAVPASNNPKLNMVVNQECLNNNKKQSMVVSEESESESDGDSEGSNSAKVLDLLGKEEGKVVRSKSTIEENGEFKSQELCSEVVQPLGKNIDAPEDEEDDESSESDSEGDTEASDEQDVDLGEKLRDDNHKQTTVVSEKEEDVSSESESDGDAKASTEQEHMDLGEKLTNNSHKQSMIVNEQDEDDSSESESEGDTEANNGQENINLGERLTNDICKQSMVVNEEEEDDSSGSESEGDSESSNDHEDLDLGGGEEQNKSRGVQSRAAIEKNQDSKSQEPCSSVARHDRDKEDGEDEEKSEFDSEEEGESSSSRDTDNNDRQTIVGNEEEDDESKSEGDTEASCEQEDLDLLGSIERSNVAQPESKVGKYVKKPNGSKVGKYVKKPNGSKVDGEKNQYIRWGKDDVIILLEGLVKVMDGVGKGKSYVRALHDLIGDSVHFKPSIIQLREKIRRLRIKYVNSVRYARKSHVNLSPHEARVVELCKMVWGNEPKTKNVGQSQCETKNVKQWEYHRSRRSSRVDYCFQTREILEEGFNLITGPEKQSEFEEDWIKLRLLEIEIYQEKMTVMKKHLDHVTDELQASLRSRKKAD